MYILAIDLARWSFQVCATDRGGAVLFNRVLSRTRLRQFLNEQSPCIVSMEACATSHFWGRFAQSRGHDVRLIPPIYVKPFVKRQKNDAADSAAIEEFGIVVAQGPTNLGAVSGMLDDGAVICRTACGRSAAFTWTRSACSPRRSTS